MKSQPKFEDYECLIYKEARKMTNKYPSVDFGDFVGQGHIAYCLALQTWDPAKASFCTHLYWQLRHQMQRAPYPDGQTDYLEDKSVTMTAPANPEREAALSVAVGRLSDDARTMVKTIFNASGELCDFTLISVKTTLKGLRAFFRGEGWSWSRAENAIDEIKSMLKTL